MAKRTPKHSIKPKLWMIIIEDTPYSKEGYYGYLTKEEVGALLTLPVCVKVLSIKEHKDDVMANKKLLNPDLRELSDQLDNAFNKV